MSFFIIPSLNICEGILLQREQPGPAKERAGAVEKLNIAKESGPEVAGRGHVLRLKNGNHPFTITRRALALATYPEFNPSTNSCRLCLMEKYTIMHRPDLATINQRDEFFTPCQHKQSKLLDNAIT